MLRAYLQIRDGAYWYTPLTRSLDRHWVEPTDDMLEKIRNAANRVRLLSEQGELLAYSHNVPYWIAMIGINSPPQRG